MAVKKPLIAIMLLMCITLLPQCNFNDHELHGYVEGQLTFLSSPTDGRLEQLGVLRGQHVKKGDLLFALEPLPESAELQSATAIINQASANLKNILYGKRPTELDAIRSQIKEIKAKIEFLTKEHQRYTILVEKSAVEQHRLDQTTQDLAVSSAQLKELEANLSTAELPGREDEIRSAEASLASTQALFDKAHWQLVQKSLSATEDAQVFDTYYKVGERVPANRPVLSLLVPRDIIAVFFIPEPQLSTIHLKQTISIHCDNCPSTFQGSIRYISPDAQYTPPVIYSNSARSKLVFRVEADITPINGKKLNPGQPIDILLQGKGQ